MSTSYVPWVEHLGSLVSDAGGFTFWSVAGDYDQQLRLLANEVVPEVRVHSRTSES